jgi:hypothetical protein
MKKNGALGGQIVLVPMPALGRKTYIFYVIGFFFILLLGV